MILKIKFKKIRKKIMLKSILLRLIHIMSYISHVFFFKFFIMIIENINCLKRTQSR